MPLLVSYAYENESARTDESDFRVSADASAPGAATEAAATTATQAKKAIT